MHTFHFRNYRKSFGKLEEAHQKVRSKFHWNWISSDPIGRTV